jgi:GH35 family endo-1,4-beta-xylanase
LRFQVYKNGEVSEGISLEGSYMFGPDRSAVSAVSGIQFEDGFIHCSNKGQGVAGLSLLWPVDGFGEVVLSTTCLPEREEPYVLNVELARARLMQITLKREDWSLFEEKNSFSDIAHESRDLFLEALECVHEDPSKASRLADKSLEKALAFSEKLAVKHADVFLSMKIKNKGLGRHSLGCIVDPERIDDEGYRKWLLEMFGFVTIPVSWAKLEPEKGRYDFDALDKCMECLSGRRVAICVGPLVQYSEEHLPGWLTSKKRNFEKVREFAYKYITKVISRYKGYVHLWTVISGMNCMNYFEFNFDQMIEMTRAVCVAAKSEDSRSKKIIEVLRPWGEYYEMGNDTVAPLLYVDTVIQRGISFDYFGLQLHFGHSESSMMIRDMMQISAKLDSFVPVPKPLYITSVSVPSASSDDGVSESSDGGVWHEAWNEKVQSQWVDQFYRVALGKPFINSVTYGGLTDFSSGAGSGRGLVNDDMQPRKAYMSIAKLQKVILKR